MGYFKFMVIFGAVLALTTADELGASQSVGISDKASLKNRNVNLRNQWDFGNCGSNVRSQDLVYYDHVTIQANSASTTLTDTVSWTGTKIIYCVSLIGNQGTTLKGQKGGVGYSTMSVLGTSAVGKDLDGIIYVYAR